MKKIYAVLIFLIAGVFLFGQGSITNISVSQRTDGSGLVDVYYDLSGSAGSYFINMRVSYDAGSNYIPISFNSMSGDKGPVTTGTGRHIIYNPTIDNPNRYSPEAKLKIVAYTVGISNPCPGTPTVSDYDGNLYHTVQIGNQCWMASNLNTTHKANGSNITRYCYDNNTSNCEMYGGLYSWNTVMAGYSSTWANPSGIQGICPNGWHIPSQPEWDELKNYLINAYVDITSDNVGNKLKSCRQVTSPVGGDCSTSTHPRWSAYSLVHGTNDFGFSGLPSGSGSGSSSSYNSLGTCAIWLAATKPTNYNNTYYARLNHNSGSIQIDWSYSTSTGLAIRCVKD